MGRLVRRIAGGFITLAVVVLVIAVASNWLLRRHTQARQRKEAETFVAATRVRAGDFVVYFDQVGSLEAEESTAIVSEVDGLVVWVVPNGVRVKQGELIMVLDTARMEEALRHAGSAYYSALDELARITKERDADIKAAEVVQEEAQGALEQFQHELKVKLDAQRAQIAFDRSALERARDRIKRLRRLAEQGLITRREVEAAESEIKSKEFALEKQIKDLELAESQGAKDELEKKAAVDKAKADLERAKGQREDEINNAKGTAEILKRGFDRANEDLAKARVYAPTDGIVVLDQEWEGGRRRPMEAGDRVWPKRRIARIPDLSTMRVYVPIAQERASDVKVGQKVEVKPDALHGKVFQGEVSEVATTAVEETTHWMPSGERIFRAFVALDKPDAKELKFGMRANVRIIVDSHQDVLSVPLECVFDREGRKKVVYVRRGGKFRETPVAVGRASEDRVIIAKGLKAGEAVALRDLGRPTSGSADLGTDLATTGGPSL